MYEQCDTTTKFVAIGILSIASAMFIMMPTPYEYETLTGNYHNGHGYPDCTGHVEENRVNENGDVASTVGRGINNNE